MGDKSRAGVDFIAAAQPDIKRGKPICTAQIDRLWPMVKIDLKSATFLQHLRMDFGRRVRSTGMIEAISVWDFRESRE